MTENLSNLVKEIDIQVHEGQIAPNKMVPNRSIGRHIIIKMVKVKDNPEISKRKAASYFQEYSRKNVS